MAVIIDIADAVVATINAATLSRPVQAVRSCLPEFELRDMGTLHISVVPAELEEEMADRERDFGDYTIHVAVQQRVGNPIIDNADNLAEFKNRVTFKGETPSLASHVGRFAILLEPIAAGKLGKAVVSGVSVARIDVANAYHGSCEIIGGDCGKLRSGPCGGAQILWKETGTGLLWGIVRVGTPTLTCRFELKQNLVPGGYAQAYLLDYAGVYQIDPAVEITVYDTLSIPSDQHS